MKCPNDMKRSNGASSMQIMPLSPSQSHYMALMLGKCGWKIVAAITASAMGGPLRIRVLGKIPSPPCCVSFSSKVNARPKGRWQRLTSAEETEHICVHARLIRVVSRAARLFRLSDRKGVAMVQSPYDVDLDRNAANF